MAGIGKVIFRIMIAIIVILVLLIALIIGIGIAGSKITIAVTGVYTVGRISNDVILGCTFIPDTTQTNNIQWEKVGTSGVVYKYENGKSLLNDQNAAFKGRASLFLGEIINGNASLKLTQVKLSDAGTYRCIITNSKGTGDDTLTFKVGGYTSVSVSSPSNDTLRCSSSYWYPKPNVTWVRDSGANITNVTIKTSFPPALNNLTDVTTELSGAQLDVQYSCLIHTELAQAVGVSMLTEFGLQTTSELTVFNCTDPLAATYLSVWALLLCLLLGSTHH
uniref:Novel protein similar to vtcn1 n=1 Tax=Xenopus tropicalis TaxID=8364 RepID=Q28G33_XENTR|nr:novel protein similar to vtcn1 [Xenopus tropicalis]